MEQNIDRLGTKYGGWILPKDIELNEDSVVYSAGVGEDISFDMLLYQNLHIFVEFYSSFL